VGIACIDYANYTVYQNTNPCFTGNQYYATNGITYASNPSTGACQGFAITLGGRGSTEGIACYGGQKTVYVTTESNQTTYNLSGFGSVTGITLYENINLTSIVADSYASDQNGLVYAINSGVVGTYTGFSC
jgi:hypothetical protein